MRPQAVLIGVHGPGPQLGSKTSGKIQKLWRETPQIPVLPLTSWWPWAVTGLHCTSELVPTLPCRYEHKDKLTPGQQLGSQRWPPASVMAASVMAARPPQRGGQARRLTSLIVPEAFPLSLLSMPSEIKTSRETGFA